jgi:hypothetical protein
MTAADKAPSVSVRFDDPQHLFTAAERHLIRTDLSAGVHTVTNDLVGHGSQLNLVVHVETGVAEVASAPAKWADVGGYEQASGELVLNTGHHVAGGPWQDGDLFLDPAYLRSLFLDPHPAPGGAVPADKVDAVSVFAHETMHILGIEGFLPANVTGVLPGAPQSEFDGLVDFINGKPAFTGPATEAVNGGHPLELEPGNIYHVSGAPHPWDLMQGEVMYAGTRYLPSQFDDAMLQDIGFVLNADHQIWFV